MATSGIIVSASLQQLLASPLVNLKIQIEGNEFIGSAFEIDSISSQVGDSPAFLLLSSTKDSNSTLISYVPDACSAREKMIYASSKKALVAALPALSKSIFVTTVPELLNWNKASVGGDSSAMTEREKEIEAMKSQELEIRRGGEDVLQQQRRAAATATGLEWNSEALEMLESFKKSESNLIYLKVDLISETIVLASAEPALKLPLDSACYILFRHAARGCVAFIYSCPDTSPVKSRLVSSSSVRGVIATIAKEVEISKKIETSDPEDITLAFIESELGPLVEVDSSSNPMPVPEVLFSKPSRPPGRKR